MVITRCIPVVLAMACVPKPVTPAAPAPHLEIDSELPIDPGVTSGVLDNGLTWFVEPNGRPANRAELRLVVKVGSTVEQEHERGLAHFIEHMAFNGTETFPGNGVVQWMESVGMTFGADANAYTSFDETVYTLQVPTDDPAILNTALDVMRDWASAMTFDPEECERERGVVLEEWRLGQGVGDEMQQFMLPITQSADSRYVQRLPIGTEEVLREFSCDTAKAFWERWYRPDLMAVMVVGEVDVQETAAAIEARFAPLEGPEEPVDRPWYRVPDHELTVGVFQSPELPFSGGFVSDWVDDVEENTPRAYVDGLIDSMAQGMLGIRLFEVTQREETAFLQAQPQVSDNFYERAQQMVFYAAKEGRTLEALEQVLIEVERVRQHGFTAGELERSRTQMIDFMSSLRDGQEDMSSDEDVRELIRVFLTNEPMPGVDVEVDMSLHYLPKVTLEDVNRAIRERFMPGDARSVVLLQPEKEGLIPPSEQEIRAVFDRVAALEIAPPEAEGETPPLMAARPEAGEITDKKELAAIAVHDWTLANGARVLLKPTDFDSDQVLFSAVSDGGYGAVSDDDYVSATSATVVSARSGLGELDLIQLQRALVGVDASASVSLGASFKRMGGEAERKNLEEMFQLMHLRMTAPRFSQKALDDYTTERVEGTRNDALDPDTRFWHKVQRTRWDNAWRQSPWQVEDFDKLSLPTIERIYRENFSSPSSWTFVFVGAFSLDEIEPLIAAYIGSLPSSDAVGTTDYDRADPVLEPLTVELEAGDAPRALVHFEWMGDFDDTYDQRLQLSVLSDLLGIRLREALREDLGGTYGVSVRGRRRRYPDASYTFTITFQCDPERVDELTQALRGELATFKAGTVDEEALASVLEQLRRRREKQLLSNGWWRSVLLGSVELMEPFSTQFALAEALEEVTADRLVDMANALLRDEVELAGVRRPVSQ